jgi:two-component system CheB/CheR fusion protein
MKASYAALLVLIHPDFIEVFQDDLNEHLEKATPFELDLKLKTKKNGYRWFRLNLRAERDSSDKPIKVVGILFDINKEKTLLAKIEEKESRLEAIYNSPLTGIILADTKEMIIDASKGIEQILGYTPKDMIGKSFLDITYKEEKDINQSKFQQLKKDQATYVRVDKRYICKDKSLKWVDAKITRTMISGKEYYLCVMVDIDKRKAAETKMKQLNQELERFAYLASHDLKEPLRTITSLTERLKEKHGPSLNKSANRYIQFIEDASSRMENVTSGLLIHSELGRKIKKYQPINLNQLVKQTRSDLSTSINENNAKIKVKRLPKISGDPMQIGLLFQNLISNSLKYRKKRTEPIIEIGYENKGDHWEFFVRDNGIGIAKSNQEKIFEVFTRLHSRNDYGGTGIGLSSCKRIVENHQGKIWVESKIRKGTIFYFTIPKKKPK